MDQNNQKIALLKPLVAQMAQNLINVMKTRHGVDLLITSTLRTNAEQDALYAQGRTTPGQVVTNAKGGQSFHNFGVAFDCVPLIGGKPNWNSPYTVTAVEAQIIGLEHGDRGYVDLPHFECRLGYSLEDFQTGKVDWSKYEVELLTNTNNNMIKWFKFLGSDKSCITYFTAEKVLQNDGMTHDFTSAQDAQQHSTVEAFIVWDGVPIGAGIQTA